MPFHSSFLSITESGETFCPAPPDPSVSKPLRFDLLDRSFGLMASAMTPSIHIVAVRPELIAHISDLMDCGQGRPFGQGNAIKL